MERVTAAIIRTACREAAALKGLDLETSEDKGAVLAVYKQTINNIYNSGHYDESLTPVVQSQISDWLRDLYTKYRKPA